jgi:hypothetical protein
VKVIVPAACFKAEQLDASTFVFKSFRVGFPTAELVLVVGNTAPDLRDKIFARAAEAGLDVTRNDDYATAHLFDIYEGFLRTEKAPFFYCDTDIVFWDSIEKHVPEFSHVSLAGRLIPKFYNPMQHSIVAERLHNCLLYVDPDRFAREMNEYFQLIGPDSGYTPHPNLVRPMFVTLKEEQEGRRERTYYFYDTWALAYHALSSPMAFSDEVDACFDHLFGGTIAHSIGEAAGIDYPALHRRAMQNPQLIRGMWPKQRALFKANLKGFYARR